MELQVSYRICTKISEKSILWREKGRNREFWCRGYYVDTVGKNTEAIRQYIDNQLREDMLNDQLTLEETSPFTGRK